MWKTATQTKNATSNLNSSGLQTPVLPAANYPSAIGYYTNNAFKITSCTNKTAAAPLENPLQVRQQMTSSKNTANESKLIMTSFYDSKVHLGARKPSFTSTANLIDKVHSHDTMNIKQSLQTDCITNGFAELRNTAGASNKQLAGLMTKPQSIGKVQLNNGALLRKMKIASPIRSEDQ